MTPSAKMSILLSACEMSRNENGYPRLSPSFDANHFDFPRPRDLEARRDRTAPSLAVSRRARSPHDPSRVRRRRFSMLSGIGERRAGGGYRASFTIERSVVRARFSAPEILSFAIKDESERAFFARALGGYRAKKSPFSALFFDFGKEGFTPFGRASIRYRGR